MHFALHCFFIMRQERFAVFCCQIVYYGFEVNGQIGSAVINNEERTVTVDLLDSVDLKKVIVTRFDYRKRLIRI